METEKIEREKRIGFIVGTIFLLFLALVYVKLILKGE